MSNKDNKYIEHYFNIKQRNKKTSFIFVGIGSG